MGFKKGYTPWSKGLTKETDSRIKNNSGNFKKGNIPWNKGKPCSEKMRAILLENCEGRTPSYGMLGKLHTEETKEKMRLAHLGQIQWNTGKTGIYTEESQQKRSESLKRAYAEGIKAPNQGSRGGDFHRKLVNAFAEMLDTGKNKVELEYPIKLSKYWYVIDVLVNDDYCYEIGTCARSKIHDLENHGFVVIHLPYSCF